MCKYCDNAYKPSKLLESGDIFITQSAKYTMYGDGQEIQIPLNYCPNCGEPIRLKMMTANERLVENVKNKALSYERFGQAIGRLNLTKEIMNYYHVDRKLAEEFIDYCIRH